MAAANSSGEGSRRRICLYIYIVSCLTPFAEAGDDDVAASYQEAFERMLDAPNRTEILGEPSDTPNTSRIRRSRIYWCVVFSSSG